jgi:P-type conjugative transfer protein TrbL
MNKNNITILAISFFLLLSVVSITAEAGLGDSIGGAVNDMQGKFQDAISIWVSPLQEIAKWLLLSLAVISYSWSAAFMVLRGADIQEFSAEFVRLVMFTGFFYWLINEAPSLTGSVVNGWIYVAGQAGGTTTSPNVGSIIQSGFNTAELIFKSDESLIPLVGALGGIIIIVMYALIAAKILFVVLEMYTVTAAGVILLGFGGNQWTGDYARRYITYTMAVGMKLFVMYLIVATGNNLITSLVSGIDPKSAPDIFSLIGILIVFQVLIWQIPDTVRAMLSGASIGSAANSAAAAASSAGSAMAGAAVGAAGGSLAVAEAIKSAQGMEGNTFGNTLGNLAQSGAEVLGNRIMGDYNASSGGMMASMAQHMRQQRTGGSGLYGGTSSGSDHIGGSAPGGSFGVGDPTTKEGTGPEQAQNASHDFGADDSSAGSEAGEGGGAGAWDTSEVGGKEHEFGAEDGGSWSWDASGTAAAGGAGDSDNPATRYRSPAVDLTRGGGSGGTQGSTTNNNAFSSSVGDASSGSSDQGVATGGMGGAPVSSASYLRSESQATNATDDFAGASSTEMGQSFTANSNLGGDSSGSIGSMVGADNMTSGAAQGITASPDLAVSDSVGQSSATNSDSGVAPAAASSGSALSGRGVSSDGVGSAPMSVPVQPVGAGSRAVTPRGREGNKAKPVGGVMQDTDSLGDGDSGGGKPLA